MKKLICVIFLFCAGCISTYEENERIYRIAEIMSHTTPEELAAEATAREAAAKIRSIFYSHWARLRLGLSSDEVFELLGQPDKINKTVTVFGISEQWVYEPIKFAYRFVYLENNILTAWQE